MTKKWDKYLLILGLIIMVVASVAIYGCTNSPNTKAATDTTDTETADIDVDSRDEVAPQSIDTASVGAYVDPWEEMKRQSTPFSIAVITQDETLIPKLRKNKYPEVNQAAQFKLVLPEHAKAPLSADAVWVMEDQHEAALNDTFALHAVVKQFARQGKPVVFFGFADANKLTEAFDFTSSRDAFGNQNIRPSRPSEDAPGSERGSVYIKINGPGSSGVGGISAPADSNYDWDTHVKSTLELTWNARKGARR
ncbi:MAG TPA: hypothetical protein VE439_09710 [Anaerolineae bacterium]|jgi:hypothetical protein|nr:hypothetical protein [Anaerolineae bacterium]